MAEAHRRRRRVVVRILASNDDDDDNGWRAKRLEYNRLLAEASEAHPFEILDVDSIDRRTRKRRGEGDASQLQPRESCIYCNDVADHFVR